MTANVHNSPASNLMHLGCCAHLKPNLLSKVGEVFAMALCRLQARLTPDATGSVNLSNLQAAQLELARLERLGVQIQEVARVLTGDGAWILERVNLTAAIQQALKTWADKATELGVQLKASQEFVEFELNPPIFQQLLELGIEYALHIGSHIELRCGIEGDPPTPMLTFDIHRAQSLSLLQDADSCEDLQWLLLTTLARSCGFTPQRQVVGAQVMLMLALTNAADHGEGTGALATGFRFDTSIIEGRHALLVDAQETSRIQAHHLLREAGMSVDVTASPQQALDLLRDSIHTQIPDVLLIGFEPEEAAYQPLIDALRIQQPRLRVVAMVEDDNAFAFSVPGSDQPARVGRQTLARTLVPAVSQELQTALPKQKCLSCLRRI